MFTACHAECFLEFTVAAQPRPRTDSRACLAPSPHLNVNQALVRHLLGCSRLNPSPHPPTSQPPHPPRPPSPYNLCMQPLSTPASPPTPCWYFTLFIPCRMSTHTPQASTPTLTLLLLYSSPSLLPLHKTSLHLTHSYLHHLHPHGHCSHPLYPTSFPPAPSKLF